MGKWYSKPEWMDTERIDRLQCSVSRALMDRVAGVGLSEAKEAPEFQAGALQPWPPNGDL